VREEEKQNARPYKMNPFRKCSRFLRVFCAWEVLQTCQSNYD